MAQEIVFSHVDKIYKKQHVALEDVSFSVNRGEFLFVIGRSGAGKSTLLKLISRQMRSSGGEIWVRGKNVSAMPNKEVPFLRRQIGLMQLEYGLVPELRVYENVQLAMVVTGQPKRLYKKRVSQTLQTMGVLHRAEAFPNEISEGEAARVLLARALVINPGILVVDEPTANLDGDAAWDLMCLLDELNRLGVTLMVGSHDRDLVSIMRKRVLTLSAGRLVADERNATYNSLAADVIEERRILNERAEKQGIRDTMSSRTDRSDRQQRGHSQLEKSSRLEQPI